MTPSRQRGAVWMAARAEAIAKDARGPIGVEEGSEPAARRTRGGHRPVAGGAQHRSRRYWMDTGKVLPRVRGSPGRGTRPPRRPHPRRSPPPRRGDPGSADRAGPRSHPHAAGSLERPAPVAGRDRTGAAPVGLSRAAINSGRRGATSGRAPRVRSAALPADRALAAGRRQPRGLRRRGQARRERPVVNEIGRVRSPWAPQAVSISLARWPRVET